MNPKRPILRHLKIKIAVVKDKERILRAARERQLVIYKGAPLRLPVDFSIEIFQIRRDWHEIFKVMNNKDLQPKLLLPARLSFKIEEHVNKIK